MLSPLQDPKSIAFVIYPGLTLLDLVGPLGVMQKFCEINPHYQTVIVADRAGAIESDNGLTVMPDGTFAEHPHPYAVFIPGGGPPTLRAMADPAIRQYVKQSAATAAFVGSVCTGALILAATGVLEGRPATTHWAYDGVLESLGSKYVRQRWVDNGKIINSAGVSAGVDMALFFVARLADEATTRQVQLWLDYDPQPPFGGIDWSRLGLLPKVMRAYHRAAAPLLTAKVKRMERMQ